MDYRHCSSFTTILFTLFMISVPSVDSYRGRPDPISNSSIRAVSYNFNTFVVEWCPRQPNVNYTLYWSLIKDYFVEENSAQLGENCVWRQNAKDFYQTAVYYLRIVASNTFGNTTSQSEFDATQSVKPDPVQKLSTTYVSATSCNLTWQHQYFDFAALIPLVFRVEYSSHWSSNVTVVDVGENILSVNLTDLIPYTEYNISVSCKPTNSGYWSDKAFLLIRTLQSVPAAAPSVSAGWFHLNSCDDVHTPCIVTVFWQPVPDHLMNGIITKYVIGVRGVNSTFQFNSRIDVFSAQAELLHDAYSYWLSIQAATQVGTSPAQYLLVSLPSAGIVPLQDVFLETTEDGNGVLIGWSVSDDDLYDNYTVFYCVGKQHVRHRCNEAPMQIVLPSNVTNVTLTSVEKNWVFSVAGNTDRGSTGLTTDWLCKYDYHATPSEPHSLFVANTSADSVLIQWTALSCNRDNKARVQHYIIQRVNNVTGASERHIVSATTDRYTLSGLTSDTGYHLSLRAASRHGLGPAAVIYYTSPIAVAETLSVWLMIVITAAAIICVVLSSAVAIASWKKYKYWYFVSISVPRVWHESSVLLSNHNRSTNAGALVVDVSQSQDNSADDALTSSGTTVQDSGLLTRSVLPPAMSVEAVDETGVESAASVTDLQYSSPALSTHQSPVDSTPYSHGRKSFRIQATERPPRFDAAAAAAALNSSDIASDASRYARLTTDDVNDWRQAIAHLIPGFSSTSANDGHSVPILSHGSQEHEGIELEPVRGGQVSGRPSDDSCGETSSSSGHYARAGPDSSSNSSYRTVAVGLPCPEGSPSRLRQEDDDDGGDVAELAD